VIVGLDKCPAGECFRELDDALVAMGRGDVCLNTHEAPEQIPGGSVAWHFENQTCDYGERPVWSFSPRHWKQRWKHVPVGYHPSMERFDRSAEPDIDVVFAGCVNGRRAHLFNRLAANGLRVVVIPPGVYGKQRDDVIARAKLAINLLFYVDGVYPTLRAAHLVANRVPLVSEVAPEIPDWVGLRVDYTDLEKTIVRLLKEPTMLRQNAELAFEAFRKRPLDLPC
jgi:hypothetical protein